MSTRGVVATTHGDAWRGVYVGSDAYPTWSGPLLWAQFHGPCAGDRDVFERDVILAHPSGYHSATDQCYCHDPNDPPHPTEDAAFYTPEDEAAEALFLEWIYVFGRHALTIYCHVRAEGYQVCTRGDGYSWQSPNYRWQFVTQCLLHAEEPDWTQIEAQGDALREAYGRRVA